VCSILLLYLSVYQSVYLFSFPSPLLPLSQLNEAYSLAEESKEKIKEKEEKIVSLLVEHSDERKFLTGKIEFLSQKLDEVRKTVRNNSFAICCCFVF
jgi:hypothetical protein